MTPIYIIVSDRLKADIKAQSKKLGISQREYIIFAIEHNITDAKSQKK
jgi:hypothetical protein